MDPEAKSQQAGGRPPPIHMFLPPETVEMVMHYGSDFPPYLAFEEEMAVVFSDMRGFTELADRFDPHEVYRTINASLAVQTRLVREHGGSVNKFLGDGLLACFSGAGRERRAVACMRAMMRELPKREGELLPCGVGFGLHAGKVLFGLLGDAARREFTVIGDVPNTAARLCGIAKPFQTLMTDAVVGALPEAERADCRFLRMHRFKGKKQPIGIYELATDP